MGLVKAIPEVDPRSAADRFAAGEAVVLDVREEDEWAAGRIPGALHIPLDELHLRQADIPSDRLIIAVCRSGSRSAAVTEALLHAGYEAENLSGGMKAWERAGLPLDPPNGYVG